MMIKPNPRRIWTVEKSLLLYQLLTEKFGPYSVWEQNCLPGRKQNASYYEFCEIFSELIDVKSGTAVDQQIQFAIRPPPNGGYNHMHLATVMRNKICALEAGFITDGELKNVCCGRVLFSEPDLLRMIAS